MRYLVQLFRIWKTTTFGQTDLFDLVAHQKRKVIQWHNWFDTLHMVLMTTKTWGHDWSEIIPQFCSVPNLGKLTGNSFTQLFFFWNGYENTHTQKHTLSKPNGTLNHSEIRTHRKWHIPEVWYIVDDSDVLIVGSLMPQNDPCNEVMPNLQSTKSHGRFLSSDTPFLVELAG